MSRALLALIARDLALATRVGGSGALSLVFFLMIVALVPFALGPDLNLLSRIGPAILWLAAVLATLIGLDRLFQADEEDGSLDLMSAAPVPLELVVLAKVVAHWLTGTNPLDRFEVARTGERVTVEFDHAAIRNRLANRTAKYIVNFSSLNNLTGAERMDGVAVATTEQAFDVPGSAWGPADAAGFRYAIASIRTLQAGYPLWARPVRITLRQRGATIDVIGIERPVQDAAALRGTN